MTIHPPLVRHLNPTVADVKISFEILKDALVLSKPFVLGVEELALLLVPTGAL
jgi:hypothetical protein